MSKGKKHGKVNPDRQPLTEGEFNRRMKQVKKDSLDNSLAIILCGLLDRGFLTPDQMQGAWEAVTYKSDSVNRGYTDPEELKKTLAEEYDIYI